METVLCNVEQKYGDTFADLHLRREWLDDSRTVTVALPGGSKIQVKLAPMMADNTGLRMKGRAFEGGGDLLLRICIVN